MLSLSGCETDYDAGKVAFAAVCEIIRKANILAMLYTSPSHTEEKPRWRVLCPFSADLDPTRRYQMVARLNGVLGGILAGESFTLSRSYYFGSINDRPPPQVEIIDGDYLDLRPDLDAGATGKPAKVGAEPASTSGTNVVPLIIPGQPPAVLAKRRALRPWQRQRQQTFQPKGGSGCCRLRR